MRRRETIQSLRPFRVAVGVAPERKEITMASASLPQFTSPRCLKADVSPDKTLQTHENRWMKMSELAGSHKQDDDLLRFNRPIAPLAFKSGVPSQVASRVKTLHIVAEDNLPQWLDVLSNTCFSLENLMLNGEDGAKNESMEAARMRRLYILYRLPDLKSIDGVNVTDLERQLARPNNPNGYRVNLNDWVHEEEVDDDSEDDEERQHGDAVEVSLYGVVRRVHADPPQESWDEPEWEKPYDPSGITPENLKETVRATQQSPALEMSEVSEDDASPRATALITDQAGCMPKFQQLPLHALCSRSEKYLPDDGGAFEIANPHRQLYFTGQHSALKSLKPRASPQYEDPRGPHKSKSRRSPGRVLVPSSEGTPPRSKPQYASLQKEEATKNVLAKEPEEPQKQRKSPEVRSSPDRIQSPPLTHVTPERPVHALHNVKSPPHLSLTPPSPVRVDMSPSRSLTSPFPMQFRSRNSKATAPPTLEKVTEQVMEETSPEENRETIDASPASLASPPGQSRKKFNKDDRPPPFPGRVVVAPLDPHEQRRKRVLGRWRNRTQLRNTPIMDNDEDDSDDDEDLA